MASDTAIDNAARSWTKILARYRRPSTARSTVEIVITVLPFTLLWVVSALSVQNGYWWGLLFTIPAAGFLVRLFALQHDCGHGALFARRGANDWTGRAIGVLTFTPYDYWRRTHAIHHASAGNLDERGTGDIHTLTVREYRALPWWGRAQYWLYRHPVVMFGIGPAWVFLCQYRLPLGLMRAGAQPWVSTIATNLGIAVPAIMLIWLLGIWPFLMIQLPITLLAATVGVWLFFVQHQFEETAWDENADWDRHEAALHGSSHYELPGILRWFTANIGVHHIHHLSSNIPYYRLQAVLRAHPELRGVTRLTLWQSIRCVRLVLWDEGQRKLVSFRASRVLA